MANHCISANPDISGVGVRAAIYAQNLLSFAPVAAHLWDGKISDDELTGVKDQSIGVLAIAFAILISTIIQATVKTSSQMITSFHATIILNLSWMNNTSTFVWFLLYVHHRTKNNPIAATWSDWSRHLLSSLHRIRQGRMQRDDKSAPSRSFTQLLRSLLDLALQAPVLSLGSIHLSLMASIGIWLWSDPLNFGAPITCDPSLVMVGGAVKFSSRALRIWSLLVYSLLLIPGINLVPGFVFFLLLHMLYNKSRKQHPQFWTQCQQGFQYILDSLRLVLDNVLRRRHILPFDQEAQIGSNNLPIQHGGEYSTTQFQAESVRHQPNAHTAFVIVGLVCLAIVNVILLANIERTLSHNTQILSSGEDEWGFGQILALLLLVVPLRDLIRSISNVRGNVVQKGFVKALREAIQHDTFDDYDFQGFIERGANPNTVLEDMKFATLLQFAAHKEKTSLVQYLLEVKEADPNIQGGEYGTALMAASATGNIDVLRPLLKKIISLDMRSNGHNVPVAGIYRMVKSLKASEGEVRQAAINGLSSLAAHEFREEIRMCIPSIVEHLRDSAWSIFRAAIECLTKLAVHAEFREEIRMWIPSIVERLKDSDDGVRITAIDGLCNLAVHAEFQEETRACIPMVVECLKDTEWQVRHSAIEFLSLRELREEIRTCIPTITERLEDSDWRVRQATIDFLPSLAAHEEFREEIQTCIPTIEERLNDPAWQVRQAAIEGLSSLAPHDFSEEIRNCISKIVECLKDEPVWQVRQATMEFFSSLAVHEFQEEIRISMPTLAERLKDPVWQVRQEVIKGLSSLTVHEVREEIQMCILTIVECLKDPAWQVRREAIEFLSSPALHEFCEARTCIPAIVECLKDPVWQVRQAVTKGLSSLTAHELPGIRMWIPSIAECLKDSVEEVRSASANGPQSLAAHAELYERIWIPSIVECLKHSDQGVGASVTDELSNGKVVT